jgi:hypothetical protein
MCWIVWHVFQKADFSTHTYQQDFHVAPNPRKIIQLDASGKQGRYVRIQLIAKINARGCFLPPEVMLPHVMIGIERSSLKAAKAVILA